ncbi:hypothetical protein ACHAXT_006123 [Thalassiosira profunda]
MPLFSLQGPRLAAGSTRLKGEAQRPATAKESPVFTQRDESSNKGVVPTESRIGDDRDSYRVGDRVEARYRGRGKRFYAGSISKVLDGDSYDVNYDDGDKDRGLSVEFIRRLPVLETPKADARIQPKRLENDAVPSPSAATPDGASSSTFEVGQRVEARYRGRGRRYYKGTVAAVLPNGMYNLDYDDGDRDRSLPAAAIRALQEPRAATTLGEVSKSPKSARLEAEKPLGDATPAKETAQEEAVVCFAIGQPIEARYKGRGRRWYKGTISECLPDGTYNITYRDGDKDVGLRAKYIRALENASAEASPPLQVDVEEKPRAVEPSSADLEPTVLDDEILIAKRLAEEATQHVLSPPSTQTARAFASVSAADGEVSFVAPVDAGRNEVAMEQPESTEDDSFEELSSVAEVISDDSAKEEQGVLQATIDANATSNPTPAQQGGTNTTQGKGNRLYRGVISKVRVVHLYEVDYPDGTRDVNLPFHALRVEEGVSAPDVQIGASVDVLSWQDRFSS